MRKKEMMSMSLDIEISEKINEASEKSGLSKSFIVNKMLERYLENNDLDVIKIIF